MPLLPEPIRSRLHAWASRHRYPPVYGLVSQAGVRIQAIEVDGQPTGVVVKVARQERSWEECLKEAAARLPDCAKSLTLILDATIAPTLALRADRPLRSGQYWAKRAREEFAPLFERSSTDRAESENVHARFAVVIDPLFGRYRLASAISTELYSALKGLRAAHPRLKIRACPTVMLALQVRARRLSRAIGPSVEVSEALCFANDETIQSIVWHSDGPTLGPPMPRSVGLPGVEISTRTVAAGGGAERFGQKLIGARPQIIDLAIDPATSILFSAGRVVHRPYSRSLDSSATHAAAGTSAVALEVQVV